MSLEATAQFRLSSLDEVALLQSILDWNKPVEDVESLLLVLLPIQSMHSLFGVKGSII